MEELVRTYARLHRESGTKIEQVILDVKALVRDATGNDEFLFTPRIVGWTVAGYFNGSKQ